MKALEINSQWHPANVDEMWFLLKEMSLKSEENKLGYLAMFCKDEYLASILFIYVHIKID